MRADQARGIRSGRFNLQGAAICYRDGQDGQRQVLLITSLDSGRWVIPKGNVGKNESTRDAAMREAREEAGLVGKASKKPIGYYTYLKAREDLPCIVDVYPLRVKSVLDDYPEKGKRLPAWMRVQDAVRAVDEPELNWLLAKIAAID